MLKRLLSAVFFLAIVSLGFSQSVGKISGVVKDKESGEPLPGVNVVLQETFLGASTDVDGFFVILNVPAGNYTISFSYIGYQPVDVENVRVVTDLTKRVDVDLTPTTIEMGEAIVVIAEKPFFEATATNTVRVMDAEDIARIPVKGVNSIVAVNAGVVSADGSGGQTDNATINVRGGRGNESLFIVDGVPYNDVVFGNVTGTIPDAAIEQVSSQFGNFSAKYGSAQSAIVNITTKGGSARYLGGFEGITSSATDPYDYNSVNAYLGGPLIPGNRRFGMFFSAEYIDAKDDDPRAGGLVIESINLNQDALPDNESSVFRYTGKLDASLGNFKITGSTTGSFRDARSYTHSYSKNNPWHNPKVKENVLAGSVRMSHVLNPSTFWDLTLRTKYTNYKEGDGFWFDDLFSYGDAVANANSQQPAPEGGSAGVTLAFDGARVNPDTDGGVFYDRGRVFNRFRKYEITDLGADLNFTKQLGNHLIEFGGAIDQNEVRYWTAYPVDLARGQGRYNQALLSLDERWYTVAGVQYGYTLEGEKLDNDRMRTVRFSNGQSDNFEESGARRPIIAGAYIQDRIEFQDFIVNAGVRWDYFQPSFKRLRDPYNAVGFGDPTRLDAPDFAVAPVENYFSPRLGFGFPVTSTTVFHASYAIFHQAPRLFDLYDSWLNLAVIEQAGGAAQGQNNGHLNSEETVTYEFGFKQQFGNLASLDLTAYYKNVKGLIDLQLIKSAYGTAGTKTTDYISTANADFGTVKGFAFSFTLRRLGPISTKIDYTLALNEGTGSSQSSSFVAAFRNPDGKTPTAIAPLDYDQRHTLSANVDIRAGKGEGGKILENSGASFLISFDSGRPYTPLSYVNILSGSSNYGTLTQYVNSAYAAGKFRIDMRIDKAFEMGKISLVPYLWIQNLLNRKNFNTVWASTGKPDDTAFLLTPEGQQAIASGPPNYASDYHALERDPTNYGIPRLIRLGLKFKF